MLVFYLIYFISGFVVEIQNGEFALRTNIPSLIFSISPLLSGAVSFIILQAISAGAQFLLEIDKKISGPDLK